MTKKIFSLILALSVVLCTFAAISPASAAINTNVSVWDGNLTGYLADGTTGSTDWFDSQKDNSVIEIYEARQLASIAYHGGRSAYPGWDNAPTTFSGKTIKLMTDIDLKNQQWLPIGYSISNIFAGTFDGNGHTIKNLYGKNYAAPTGAPGTPDCFGLFGTLAGTVKNLIIENVTYDLDLSVVSTSPVAGALCGRASYYNDPAKSYSATVENCAVKNVQFNVTNSATFSANSATVGVAPVCGAAYRLSVTDTYVKDVTFKFGTALTNFQYGGFANRTRSYVADSYENCYLANATETVANATATDLKWGHVYTNTNLSVKLCYTTSNATESTNIPTDTSGANVLIKAADVARIKNGMTSSELHPTGSSYSADTANKNGGFPLLTMEAVPVYNLTITKNGDKFTASAVFNDVPETTKLFIAAYDKTTDMLVFADAIDSSIAAKEISDYDPAKHEIRAFVWDIADYTPLVNSVTYTE